MRFIPKFFTTSVQSLSGELASAVTLAGQAATLGIMAAVVLAFVSAVVLASSCMTTLLVQWYVGPIQPALSAMPLRWAFDEPTVWPKPRAIAECSGFVNVANAQIYLDLTMLATAERAHMITVTFRALNNTGHALFSRKSSFPTPVVSWIWHPVLPTWWQSRHITVPFTPIGPLHRNAMHDTTSLFFEMSTAEGVLILDSSVSMERTMHGLAYYLQSPYTYLPTMVSLTATFYVATWTGLVGLGVPLLFYLFWGQ